jgi:single-strand DNA-binding protein
MADLNTYCCTGRIGTDVEVRPVNGKDLAKYRLAVGLGRDDTLWWSVEHWNIHPRLLEMLQKGTRVAINGSLKQDSWTAKDGAPKTQMVLVVGRLEVLSPKSESNGEQRQGVIAGAARKPKWEADDDSTPF